MPTFFYLTFSAPAKGFLFIFIHMIDCKINKELEIGTHISFNYGTSLVDGYIREKTNLDRGDISFLIETEDGKFCRIKHRNLDLFYIYKS